MFPVIDAGSAAWEAGGLPQGYATFFYYLQIYLHVVRVQSVGHFATSFIKIRVQLQNKAGENLKCGLSVPEQRVTPEAPLPSEEVRDTNPSSPRPGPALVRRSRSPGRDSTARHPEIPGRSFLTATARSQLSLDVK